VGAPVILIDLNEGYLLSRVLPVEQLMGHPQQGAVI
jgi:hypothetical protein